MIKTWNFAFVFCFNIYSVNYDNVERLNGVISLVTVFEELSHIMSLFWSRNKVNRKICLFFTNRT